MPHTVRAELALDARARLAEGPAWDARTGHLLWVDIPAGLVHRFDPATGTDTALPTGSSAGAALPCGAGDLVVAVRDGLTVLDEHGRGRTLADLAVAGVRMNDATVGPDGAVWVGSMAEDRTPGAGRLYRVAPDGAVSVELDGVTISNGLEFTPDGQRLYYIDTPTLRVDVFDVEPDPAGRLRNRRAVVDVGAAGRPDGMTLDDAGCLWVALAGGGAVHRYTPDGVLDTIVELPVATATSCAFGGDGSTLYITTGRTTAAADDDVAGGIFAVRPGCGGPAARVFRPA